MSGNIFRAVKIAHASGSRKVIQKSFFVPLDIKEYNELSLSYKDNLKKLEKKKIFNELLIIKEIIVGATPTKYTIK